MDVLLPTCYNMVFNSWQRLQFCYRLHKQGLITVLHVFLLACKILWKSSGFFLTSSLLLNTHIHIFFAVKAVKILVQLIYG